MTNWLAADAPSVTAWVYDPLTARLSGTMLPDKLTGQPTAQGSSYQYTLAGRLQQVTDPRQITSTLSYTLGIPTVISHSDGTPAIVRTLNRLGLVETEQFGDQSASFTYGNLGDVSQESITAGPLSGLTVARTVTSGYLPLGRELKIGSTTAHTTQTTFNQGRLASFAASGVTTSPGFEPNSELLASLATPAGTQTLAYDTLDRLTSTALPGVDGHSYRYDSLSRISGDTNSLGQWWNYTYDSAQQLQSALNTNLVAQLAAFASDSAGNITLAPGALNPSVQVSRTHNRQNQITSIAHATSASIRGQADPSATLSILAGALSVSTSRAGQDFAATAQVGNPGSDLYLQVTNVATLAPIANLSEVRATNLTTLYVPAGSQETLTYDNAGNLTIDGRWVYTWDAYNRLVRVESKAGAPEASKRRIEFTYDAQGRRIQKQVSVWNPSTLNYELSTRTKFVYDGWKLFAELNGTNNTPIRTYGWAGNRLLTIEQKTTGKVYIPLLDIHGNVTALVARDTGGVEARYEYGPYGLLVRALGPMALENPIRFSSEYQDDITGFIYYGYRYFNPATQRWLNPDPIGFSEGANLYGFVGNDPINGRDALGLVEPESPRFVWDIHDGIKGIIRALKNKRSDSGIEAPPHDPLDDFIKVPVPGAPPAFGEYLYIPKVPLYLEPPPMPLPIAVAKPLPHVEDEFSRSLNQLEGGLLDAALFLPLLRPCKIFQAGTAVETAAKQAERVAVADVVTTRPLPSPPPSAPPVAALPKPTLLLQSPSTARLPQDIAVNPNPPVPLPLLTVV